MAMPPEEPPQNPPGGGSPGYPPPGGGGYPPPGGGSSAYPPPGGGSYPPPGGYQPPGGNQYQSQSGWSAPSPGPGYGHAGGRIDIGQTLRYAWAKFGQNAGPLIICTLIVFAVQFVVGIVSFQIDAAGARFLISLIGTVIGLILTRGLIRAGLSVVNGNRVDPGQVFRFDRIGGFIVGSVVLGLLQGLVGAVIVLLLGPIVGAILAVLAIAAINALFGFYGFAIVERDLDGISGLKRSAELTRPNFLNVFLFFIVMGLITLAGALACGVGLLVAIPLTYVAEAHAYRQLIGEPVAP